MGRLTAARLAVPALILRSPAAVGGEDASYLDVPADFQICSASGDCEPQYLWPARACWSDPKVPAWWATPFTRMRLRMQASGALTPAGGRLTVNQTTPLTATCRLLDGLCTDCSAPPGCPKALSVVDGTDDLAMYFPPRGGCAFIDELPEGAGRVRATWEPVWDPTVPLKLGAGLLLFWNSRELSQSSMVHALIGAALPLVLAVLSLLWVLIQELRRLFFRSVPLSGSITAIAVYLPIVARDAIITWVVMKGPSVSDVVKFRDPVYELPVGLIGLGVAAALILGTVSFGASMSMRYFGSLPDPEGDVGFVIGADGRRIDLLPPAPLQQRGLGWVFWAVGVGLVMTGTRSEAFSAAVLVAAVSKDSVAHFIRMRLMAAAATSPGRLRRLVSARAYEDDGRAYTERAITALRAHIQAHPELLCRSRNGDSELRMRRFSDGGQHCERPVELEEEAGRRWCSVQ